MSKKITVLPYEKGLLYKKGRFVKLIDSGDYIIYPWQSSHINKMDIREHTHTTQKKKLLTKDRCDVTVVFVVRYKVIDPVCAAHKVENYNLQLMQDLQFAAQNYIRAQVLENIFANPDEFTTKIHKEVSDMAKEYGVCVSILQIEELTSPEVSSEVVEIWQHEKGLLFCKGKFEKLLDSGRYTLHSWQHSTITKIDMRETTKNVQSKNIYTKNDVKVNISLLVYYKVTAPQKICSVKHYDSQIFQDVQGLLEENIRNYTVEEALHENALVQKLQRDATKTQEYGVEVTSIKLENIHVPNKQDQVVDIWEYEKGLLYREGKFEQIITSGRYVIRCWEPVHIVKLDLREASQTIQAQEILTKDKIGIRITLVAQYKITDPIAAVHNVENYQQQLYQDLQLTLRENITGRMVEEILEDRDVLSEQLLKEVAPRSEKYGILIQRIGIKDIILPGVVRNVFLQEVEADRRGRADRISARYAISVARSKANAAKILQENPNVMRLKELETLAELASKEGNVIIIPGLNNLYSPSTAGANDDKV